MDERNSLLALFDATHERIRNRTRELLSLRFNVETVEDNSQEQIMKANALLRGDKTSYTSQQHHNADIVLKYAHPGALFSLTHIIVQANEDRPAYVYCNNRCLKFGFSTKQC